MTVAGWIGFGLIAVFLIGMGCVGILCAESIVWKIISITVAIILTVLVLIFMFWYYKNTAGGQRAIVDQRSDFNNGLDRTITVYTANGDIIAQYNGKIDIEGNDGGYVIFDFEGKRYMYYNCFVESIADIGA